jgi:hypothetical protein
MKSKIRITLGIMFILSFCPIAEVVGGEAGTCGSKNAIFFDQKRGMYFKFLGFGTTEKIWKNKNGELANGIAFAFWGPDNKKWAIMGPRFDYLWFTDDFSAITWLTNSSVLLKNLKLRVLDRDGTVLFNLEFLKCD